MHVCLSPWVDVALIHQLISAFFPILVYFITVGEGIALKGCCRLCFLPNSALQLKVMHAV